MTLSQRNLRWGALPLLLVALSGLPAHARVHHNDAWARDHFAAAERMREALNGRPLADRTRRDYQRVINAYRNVYFGAPTSTKADPSVVAVAETLVEMGRRFDDDKILNEAIAQYKFLRKEYPGSKYRGDALFTIGEIYKDDLNDPDQARTVFQEFLHRYPHNRLAEDAQQGIAELDRQAEDEKKAASQNAAQNAVQNAVQKRAGKESADKGKSAKDSAGKDADTTADGSADDSSGQETAEHHSGRLPRVTGIRHWSTPDYTRVAIDLESEIKFGSQRIANPDRIFFDLRDTKLASTLVGKSFDVDDGFLKKIRVAQFQPGRTRVVLEVDDLSDYEAFLLPNPYRLIIDIHGKDIHGKDGHGKDAKNARAKSQKDAVTATADVEAAPKAVSKSDSPAAAESVEMKDELRAAAGKAPVTSDDVDAKILPKGDVAGSKPHAPGPSKGASSTVTANNAKTSPPVTKVVVEADDDDDDAPAVKVAKLDAAVARSRTAAGGAKKKTSDSDTAVPDEKPSDDSADSHPASKSSSRLASSRKRTDLDVHEAKPTASGDRSLIRALGLKIGKIVIDPGHGGHDTGTIGPNGLEEKDLVLEVGRRLGKLLETRLGAEVVYTRKDDTFIPLETRTAVANQQRADLFVSIHANSSHDPAARGVETYYLNFTSSPEALEVAARENAVSEKSIYELQDLVKKIALKEKIEESREFAGDVQESLHSGLAAKSPGIRNRGVKKAPFIVLIGANMPSILAEISFVSNPADEHRLQTTDYRQKIAESLYRGIAKYVNGLSGVKVASKMDKAAGQ
ncbi:MAG TPA: N-acetylmuramoyl-L-alanine amidase [Candidatus Sulfotelmatobacter sp.]|nr:N-acetylmuramoyl-L-alanine amidase [Candidatus Sulfotelmatobacter sp.]